MRSSRAGSSCVISVRLLVVALLWVAAHDTFAASEPSGTERTAAEAMADYGAPVAPVEPDPSTLERFISSMPGSALRGDVQGVYPTMDIPRFDDGEANITIDGRLDE
ncbi:MAG: hypothetical protein O7G84_09835, partial [Gammaproteobacteria bacterium]|nr:hypothetical protein [Gammaproteobacteria bacterium]